MLSHYNFCTLTIGEKMIIKNVDFSNCVLASGSMSFFGSGYWYHNVYQTIVPGFEITNDLSFVTKTTTFHYRPGNMKLDSNFQPKEYFPSCVRAYPFKGVLLNAADLGGPGALSLFDTGNWQDVDRPFFLSFMPIYPTKAGRYIETQSFCQLLKKRLPEFNTKVGLQLNLSYPNSEYDIRHLADEAITLLTIFRDLQIPLDLKVGLFFPVEIIMQIEEENLCDIITIGNAVKFGSNGINWNKLFHNNNSPLSNYGGCGLSGKPLLSLISREIRYLRSLDFKMPIKASGGITSPSDVVEYKEAGANAVEIATVLALRPWRVKSIAAMAEKVFN